MKNTVSTLAASLLALGALTSACLPAASRAETAYPTKPIQLVVPFSPGGATDVIGRLLAKSLGERLGQTVVVENRPGAGTVIAATHVAKSAPDGYTLLISSGTTFTINPAINPKLPYDSLRDFEPIGIAGRTGLIVLASKQISAKDPKQFVSLLKAEPEKYAYASFGNGSTAHFTGELMLRATGTKMVHVPYKGSAPAMTDLIGGQIPFSVDTVSAAIPQLKAGKVRAIGVTTARRSPLLPDVPTFAEQGYAIDADTWIAVVAPRGVPAAVKRRLEKALADVIALPEVREKLIASGFEPGFVEGAAVEALIERELPLMRATAQRANIQSE